MGLVVIVLLSGLYMLQETLVSSDESIPGFQQNNETDRNITQTVKVPLAGALRDVTDISAARSYLHSSFDKLETIWVQLRERYEAPFEKITECIDALCGNETFAEGKRKVTVWWQEFQELVNR